MNERIRELAEKAQAYADQQWLEAGYPSWENYQEVFAEDYNKKLAELIVKDYAKKTIQGLMSDSAFVQAMDEYYENKWSHRFD